MKLVFSGAALVVVVVLIIMARSQSFELFADDKSGCDSSYPTVCIPPGPPDLDCSEIQFRSFEVIGADPHRLDGDGNGIGCER